MPRWALTPWWGIFCTDSHKVSHTMTHRLASFGGGKRKDSPRQKKNKNKEIALTSRVIVAVQIEGEKVNRLALID